MSTIQYVTKETLEQMKAELQRMRAVDRPAASKAIAEAREKGDLKENAEYDAAKEAQGILEARIAALEGAMANVRVLDESSIDTSKVSILTKVALTNLKTNKQVVYKIVSENEADLKAGKISEKPHQPSKSSNNYLKSCKKATQALQKRAPTNNIA